MGLRKFTINTSHFFQNQLLQKTSWYWHFSYLFMPHQTSHVFQMTHHFLIKVRCGPQSQFRCCYFSDCYLYLFSLYPRISPLTLCYKYTQLISQTTYRLFCLRIQSEYVSEVWVHKFPKQGEFPIPRSGESKRYEKSYQSMSPKFASHIYLNMALMNITSESMTNHRWQIKR